MMVLKRFAYLGPVSRTPGKPGLETFRLIFEKEGKEETAYVACLPVYAPSVMKSLKRLHPVDFANRR